LGEGLRGKALIRGGFEKCDFAEVLSKALIRIGFWDTGIWRGESHGFLLLEYIVVLSLAGRGDQVCAHGWVGGGR